MTVQVAARSAPRGAVRRSICARRRPCRRRTLREPRLSADRTAAASSGAASTSRFPVRRRPALAFTMSGKPIRAAARSAASTSTTAPPLHSATATPASSARRLAEILSPRRRMTSAGGPRKRIPAALDPLHEFRVLGDEAPSRPHGIGAGANDRLEEPFAIEIGGYGAAAMRQQYCDVGVTHERRVAVDVRVERDAVRSEPSRARSDFTARRQRIAASPRLAMAMRRMDVRRPTMPPKLAPTRRRPRRRRRRSARDAKARRRPAPDVR